MEKGRRKNSISNIQHGISNDEGEEEEGKNGEMEKGKNGR